MENIENLAKLVRYYILKSTTVAGTGHPSSSMSATDILTTLFFNGHFRADLNNPKHASNDRLIFSKGHASPLFYALYAVAGKVSEDELWGLRKFQSHLEGHPTMEFPYTEAATGSLGQGLSIGVGQALNAKLEKLDYRTYVLLGDSEMAEGSVWEAMSLASHYKLNNLVAILDVNRLGQRGETMYGHNTDIYDERAQAFGWDTIVIDGHNLQDIESALIWAKEDRVDLPRMIIAKTLKGKGVSFMENKDGWHGKAVPEADLQKALDELGQVDNSLRGEVAAPSNTQPHKRDPEEAENTVYKEGDKVATRKAYGQSIAHLVTKNKDIVVLDAETSNSTYAEFVKKTAPERFYEMYIAEQNMVGTAQGFSARGKIPFVSTFAAFFSRAYDQIRMSQYSNGNIKFVGSHVGVSIGEDGASQMGLEDIAMFRSILGSVILYPSDAVSTYKLTELASIHKGNVYIRTTRAETQVLYKESEEFKIGGSKTLKESKDDVITVIGAGITLHEALKAYEELKKDGIHIRVVDLYSVKPIDLDMLKKSAEETKGFLTVEDHHHEGGIGEAILYLLSSKLGINVPVKILSVKNMPRSGKPQELLDYEDISAKAIIEQVKKLAK